MLNEDDAAMPPPPLPPRRKITKPVLQGEVGSSSSSRSVHAPRASSSFQNVVAVEFRCNICVPRTWTLGDTLSRIREYMRAEHCVVDIKVPLKITLSVPSPVTNADVVTGAGRSVRVQHDTVARNGLCFLIRDLATLRCDRFSHKLLQSVLCRDRKCALATFQASTAEQRLRSFAAALRRIGLDDKADDIIALIQHLPARNTDVVDSADVRPAAPVPVVAIEDNTSQTSSNECPSPDNAGEASGVASDAVRLSRRIDAIEAWAHALDSQSCSSEIETGGALTRTKELLLAMATRCVAEAVKDLQSQSDQASQSPTTSLLARVDQLQASLEATQVQMTAIQETIQFKEHHVNEPDSVDIERRVSNVAAAVATACNRVAQLEQHVLKVTEFVHKLRSEVCRSPAAPSQKEVMALLQMHTNAISQTWQWVASNVKVTQQHAAWLHGRDQPSTRPNVHAPRHASPLRPVIPPSSAADAWQEQTAAAELEELPVIVEEFQHNSDSDLDVQRFLDAESIGDAPSGYIGSAQSDAPAPIQVLDVEVDSEDEPLSTLFHVKNAEGQGDNDPRSSEVPLGTE
eukprot:6461218-Amphidinium_carterae.1